MSAAGAAGPERRLLAVSNWPMWVIGFTLLVDGMDQYIVRGSSNQIKTAFQVHDTEIGLLFSAFILVNGIITLPAGFLGDRWNRTRAMAVVIVAWSAISALGGLVPTGAFALLVVVRASLGFGQAVTDPSGSSVIADYYGTERRGRAFSIQQCLSYIGLGMGLAIGGVLGPLFHGGGWRLAFFVSLLPGLLVAYLCWKLPEPSRGTADRAHVTGSGQMEMAAGEHPPLFPHGIRHFAYDMADGLRRDVGTILKIPTMRYALVGVSTVGFVVTAVATWMPNFYQNQLHQTQEAANGAFGALAILGGIPGTVIGGWIADRWVNRFLGARVVIPAVCIVISAALFMVSFIPMAFGLVFAVQLVGFLSATACVPALRAGLSDAAPAHLRGAGFGAFNLAAVIFGSAAAPLVTSAIAEQFGGNYRTAFLIILPIAFLGASCLMLARKHIETDAAKVFEAVVMAMAAEQAHEAAYAAGEAAALHDGGGAGPSPG
ncbi:MAG TPA: MFS transporter [Acidimicrobiales bacterium]|nr:MFS transporter [Acidimicrobiales bacterium]